MVNVEDYTSPSTRSYAHQKYFFPSGLLINSGATNHIISSPQLLQESSALSNAFVIMPNGQKAEVTHICNMKLSDSITLYKILYVPFFQC